MAINSFDDSCDGIPTKSQGSSNCFKSSDLSASWLGNLNFGTDDNMSNIFKNRKLRKNVEHKSPYISGDNIQLLSQVTGKRFVSKKDRNQISSFPSAAKLYKANSDEFKALKKTKKVQKSVLTLPNKPAHAPQLTTVSDVNDSEYFNQDEIIRRKTKKRTPIHNRKPRGKNYEYYDRDAIYCSQMDISLDCSSSDTIKKRVGRNKKISNSIVESDTHVEGKVNPHDVWAILRNINTFRFRQSPQISENSFETRKRIKNKKRRNRKDMRVFETHTEEFAYISSIEVDNRSTTVSQSSSFDKITVIDKQTGFNKLCKGFGNSKQNKGGKLFNPKAKPKNERKKNKLCVQHNNISSPTNESKKLFGDSVLADKENKPFLANNEPVNEAHKNGNIEKDKGININVKVFDIMSQASQCSEILYSGCARPSKIDSCTIRDKSEDKFKLAKKHSNDSEQQVNGITKVVLSKGHISVEHNELESPVRRHNQTIIPKVTQTAIQRRLNKQKYPIVILGRDQLSSSFKVIDQEHTQFEGLNEKVWPFMLQWYGMERTDRPFKTTHTQRKIWECNQNKKVQRDVMCKNVLPKNIHDAKLSLPKGNKKPIDNLKSSNNKLDLNKKTPIPLPNLLNVPQTRVKHKPIQQLRNKMLKLLYKNSSIESVVDGSCSIIKKIKDNNTINIDMYTVTPIKSNENNTKITVASPIRLPLENKHVPVEKRTWTKAKWASDFIDNIIRKIKAGAYYTHDSKVPDNKCDSREVNIQTVSTCNINAVKSIDVVTIPGFDTVLPALEIETMNKTEISVKHCMTNILVHFDVTALTEPLNTNQSFSLMPIDCIESHTKAYKCKTSLLNAVLPAELCTILPKILCNILDCGKQLSQIPIDKLDISPLSKITHCQGPVPVQYPFEHSNIYHLPMSQKLWLLLKGSYINTNKIFPKFHIVGKTSLFLTYERLIIENLMPRLTRVHLFNYEMNPTIHMILKAQKDMPSTKIISENVSTCQALVPYLATYHKLISAPRFIKQSSLIEVSSGFVINNVTACLNVINSIFSKNYISLHFTMRHCMNDQDILSLSVGSFITSYPLNGGTTKSLTRNNKLSVISNKLDKPPPSKCNQCVDLAISRNNSTISRYKSAPSNNTKLRKKGFVRLYKKCKSTSNIDGEKSTSLSRITDLDDFFQALGSGKLLSGIFDSQSAKKIISSIREMENWTTEINPRQALLVLLLANKKDTSNLLRYRPLILQGIAVNRITKANELDLEIEVIERENINSFSQYEGISYLPASVKNQDNLFEELCWIAKNTASDYQRPFDELSEKLLKSLLEKRKKLNPSYLRVMARYVGLGLLKSPAKK